MRSRLALALLALAVPAAVLAQGASTARPSAPRGANREGFYLGLDPVTYLWLRSDHVAVDRTVGGAGLTIRVGWNFTDRWALLLDVPVADLRVSSQADYLLSHGDIALRATPVALRLFDRPFLPFAEVGGGFVDVSSTYYPGGAAPPQLYDLAGENFSVGAGALWYAAPSVAISIAGWWSTGTFNDERIGNTTAHNQGIGMTSYRVQAGVEWHAARRARCRC